ncbi:KpsF/GutQ family sugar-phosphate isomerase [Anaeromusa sp.]|uniref:KpsF/GutQ family sugar-phosphate isomerase n=1 Tax=Anaeromusa sp. TaxID=1872520 RepID=UPI0026102166|nr:KpsF/GutQ family sugar-phosphate isomerase [Anaeromusa sp.]MDD3156974.1 KpsF/GutQ family sugar-phosphate isomerase [Anaeromusa sp.]NCB77456.1 KpsF/GutQ family sugar-phosphate isomerase [Negativicutes bacterium]
MIEQARQVLRMEAAAIEALIPRIDEQFVLAAQLILETKGRLIVTGMGKPGHVGQKITATMLSTGTPSFFLHPAEGIHGDLGMVTEDDIVLAISNSGETSEVINILPSIRRIGAKIIAICGNAQSTLAQNADVVLDASVEQEACPLGLAPTTSTTAELAMGDALAVVLMSARKFTANDFAVFHPGGALGRKLLMKVANVMHGEEENPTVTLAQSVKEALFVITDKGLGATSVVDAEGKLVGLITDGDIRRGLEKGLDFLTHNVGELMTKQPQTITAEKLAAEALRMMEQHRPKPITVLPVVDKEGRSVGLVHVTDLLRQGIV